ncbi:unnamed protein product, partial [marine sediment metagenome]
PHGIGKQKKVVAFCEDSDIEAAQAAGAIEAGCDELVKKVSDGWMDFAAHLVSVNAADTPGTDNQKIFDTFAGNFLFQLRLQKFFYVLAHLIACQCLIVFGL